MEMTTERWAYAVGGVYMESNQDLALTNFQLFERWAADQLGPEHPVVALVLARQGWCRARLGDHRNACEAYRRSLHILEATVGAGHPAARRVSAYLAAACEGETGTSEWPPHTLEGIRPFNPLGPEGAEGRGLDEVAREVEAAATVLGLPLRLGPPGNRGASGYLFGTLLREAGEYQAAAAAFAEYERWVARERGPTHDGVLQALNQLAYCYRLLADTARVCELYERSRRILIDAYPGNPYIEQLTRRLEAQCPAIPSRWLYGVGEWLGRSGRVGDAQVAFDAYHRWAEAQLGPRHPYTLRALALRGYCAEELGQMGRAYRLYRKLLELRPEAAAATVVVGDLERFLTEHPGADRTEQQDWRSYVRSEWVPPGLHELEPSLEEIGDLLKEAGHVDEAASVYEAVEAWMLRQGSGVRLGEILAKQGWCQARLGNRDVACHLYERAKRAIEERSGPDTPFVREIARYLAEACR